MHLVLIGECGGGTVVVSMTNISFFLGSRKNIYFKSHVCVSIKMTLLLFSDDDYFLYHQNIKKHSSPCEFLNIFIIKVYYLCVLM